MADFFNVASYSLGDFL